METNVVIHVLECALNIGQKHETRCVHVWELFCKTWEFILHNDLENARWVIGYGTGLEFILHTTRGARIYFAQNEGG